LPFQKAHPVSDLPSLELLQSTHTFPGNYMFKVIGEDDHTLAARVMAAVRREVAEDHEPALSIRRTASGRHMCVTIEPHVTDAQQVLAIYERIYALEGLVMVW
jgi:putative lipoic acid-binding regulatory protein